MKAGLNIETDLLEAHYLAGGDVRSVVNALIAADKADITLSFQRAAAIDLAGRDVFEAVRTSVYPKVIDCPDPTKSATGMLDAVAKDGIRLLVKVRVTVRMNIEQVVGGATEETVIARVGQGIVSAIGSAPLIRMCWKTLILSAARCWKAVDAQTAFEIVSIDIADISVAGAADAANVGALLETERAEADKKLRQAEAEGRALRPAPPNRKCGAGAGDGIRLRSPGGSATRLAQALREGKLG